MEKNETFKVVTQPISYIHGPMAANKRALFTSEIYKKDYAL